MLNKVQMIVLAPLHHWIENITKLVPPFRGRDQINRKKETFHQDCSSIAAAPHQDMLAC